MNCSKCKKKILKGVWHTHHGQLFHFCKTCNEILETFPDHAKIIHEFIKDEKEMTKVQKNIFEARTRRVLGETYWSNSSQDVVG